MSCVSAPGSGYNFRGAQGRTYVSFPASEYMYIYIYMCVGACVCIIIER
jgi:hypothetical protein